MIIGLTGKNAAGKGESAKYLEKKGFAHFSLSDELRNTATKRGIGHSRDELISFGKKIREEKGTGYLASLVNGKIASLKKEGVQKIVVDSIRSIGEVGELKKNDDFELIAIDADSKLRFERIKKRNREGDSSNFEEFMLHEQKENSKSGAGQQMDLCIEKADHVVSNNSTLEDLWKKMDKLAEVER